MRCKSCTSAHSFTAVFSAELVGTLGAWVVWEGRGLTTVDGEEVIFNIRDLVQDCNTIRDVSNDFMPSSNPLDNKQTSHRGLIMLLARNS